MIGKKFRMSKIIHPVTKRTCIVPLDHGVTLGPIKGLINIIDTINSIASEKTDAIVLHKGIFKELINYPEILRKCNFILHMSASSSLSNEVNRKRLVSTVEQAVKFGAIGVSMHVNLGNENEGEMVSDFGMVSDACIDWGMPLLAMMYVRDDEKDSFEPSQIAHAARIAEEIGADMVKVNCPQCPESIKEIVDSVNIPVIISGGEKVDTYQILVRIKKALDCGANGVSIGRNVFQAEDPGTIIGIISDMVHNRITFKEAENIVQRTVKDNNLWRCRA